MIEAEQAIKNATTAINEFLSGNLNNNDFSQLLVEEVEHDEDDNQWLITLGFNLQKPNTDTFKNIGLTLKSDRKYDRKYKIFKINDQTGDVLSMKIRTI